MKATREGRVAQSDELLRQVGCYYKAVSPGGEMVVGTSPEALRDFLQHRETWPAGRHEVFESIWFSLQPGPARPRWGVAVKIADGAVELIRDQPA